MVSKPTTRLLAALELLQSRGRVTGPELAAQLQVHLRTVRRYVVALVDIGVPVVAERGRDGAYLLTPGFRLPPMMFSDDEALALAIGLLAARELGLASTRIAVASAQAKLERVMPVALKSRLRAIDQTVHLDLQRPAATADSRALATLSEAAQRQQRVLLHYRSPQQVDTERQFDCFGLAFYAGHWYAVGHCHLRHGLRSFRLDRVQRAAPLPASFGAPPPFDALAYLKHSIATLPRDHAVQVVLHAGLDEVRSALFAEIGTLQVLPGKGGPRVLLQSEVDDLDWFARELARLPFALEIRQPSMLAQVLAGHARRLAADARRSLKPRRAV